MCKILKVVRAVILLKLLEISNFFCNLKVSKFKILGLDDPSENDQLIRTTEATEKSEQKSDDKQASSTCIEEIREIKEILAGILKDKMEITTSNTI